MRNGDQEEKRGGIAVELIVLVNHLKIEMKTLCPVSDDLPCSERVARNPAF